MNKKQNYLIKSLNGLAYGFFASLIVGTILKQAGTYLNLPILIEWGNIASFLMGPAIGVGIAFTIEAKGLNLITATIAGAIGAGTIANGTLAIGNPVGAYIATIAAVEAVRLIQGKTPVDILLVPLSAIGVAGLVTMFVAPYVGAFINWTGALINTGTTMQPLIMSIVVAVLMGMALTAPISSAAIGIMLGLEGIAAGAALIGCCAQMIGFAVMSYEDNDIGDVIAIGIGTSMLQFKNIVKHPLIWLPPIITSAILAPIGIILFNIQTSAIGSGMGTAGLVGPLSAIGVMGNDKAGMIIVFTIILPLIVNLFIFKGFRRANWIKKGDLKLDRL
ncbi:MAG: PTS sugar transporter subunit IIC [Erysipelotrichaceae bacterium]|nr:PTS sugar transporter subunit IIC [Erysipelotrichaceae bacterium]MDD3810342.1 PTS sugar transporter subunit IIC [Erysipelotrichaceae bacterium]